MKGQSTGVLRQNRKEVTQVLKGFEKKLMAMQVEETQ